MSNVLYTNVRILDGTGEHPYLGEVLIQGNRIRRVARGTRSIPMNGNTVIDGAGATLMPGMVSVPGRVGTNANLRTRSPYSQADKTVDVHVSWLRRKLRESGKAPRYLHTIRGVGLRLDAPGS